MMRGSGSKNGREAGEEGLLEICCPENAALRLDKILSSGLGLSREQVKAANPGRVHHRRGKNRLALHQGQRDPAAAGPDRSIEPPAHIQKAPTVIPWGLSTFVFRASFAGDKVLHAVQSSRPAGEI